MMASCATPPASSAASLPTRTTFHPANGTRGARRRGRSPSRQEDEITDGFAAAALQKKYERGGAMVVQSAKENTALSGLAHYVARSSWGSAVQRGHRP